MSYSSSSYLPLPPHPQNHLFTPPSSPVFTVLPSIPKLTNRRSFLLLSSLAATSPLLLPLPSRADVEPSPSESATITDRIFMDFSVCPSYFRSDRTVGSDLAACPDSELIGRVVFGLYGKLLPQTVNNFKVMCNSTAYKGTLVHKILQGEFFVAGKQGRRDKGEVRLPSNLTRNMEVVDPKAFSLKHSRPGVLSLCLSENDDYDEIKLDPEYRNVEFLVTTGPGPCPHLDGENIVFGTVLEGMDVVRTIATVPTYKPADRIRFFNDFAEFIGDERAQTARTMWNKPLKTVYISDCGELKVAKPSLSPSLP